MKFISCWLSDGRSVDLPVVQGIFKHLPLEKLRVQLTDPLVLKKYTEEGIRRTTWSVLRAFSPDWIKECFAGMDVPEARRRAILFLLG